jgi:hypothetical protein
MKQSEVCLLRAGIKAGHIHNLITVVSYFPGVQQWHTATSKVMMKDVLKVKSEKICSALFVMKCSETHELARIENIHFVFLV